MDPQTIYYQGLHTELCHHVHEAVSDTAYQLQIHNIIAFLAEILICCSNYSLLFLCDL